MDNGAMIAAAGYYKAAKKSILLAGDRSGSNWHAYVPLYGLKIIGETDRQTTHTQYL